MSEAGYLNLEFFFASNRIMKSAEQILSDPYAKSVKSTSLVIYSMALNSTLMPSLQDYPCWASL
jgi:hypothetical protein